MSTLTRSTSRKRAGPSDDYLDLVKDFPLHPIRSRAEFKVAGDILDKLVGRDDLTKGQLDYVESLVHFVAAYERESIKTSYQSLSTTDLLRQLMEANNMNTSDLGEILGG